MQPDAVAKHARKVAKRFRQVAARLLLDRNHHREELHFRQGNALHQAVKTFGDWHADPLLIHDFAELSGNRLWAFV